jgi:glutaredoxin|tara:strand:- start:39 stop:275 length:237 start_codon:yes stop_codon:yes gene_type:complete
MINIEIYSKQQCPFCDYAKLLAEDLNRNGKAEYAVFELGTDFNREELLEKFPTARTFPQIKVDGVSIGGWDQFKKLIG